MMLNEIEMGQLEAMVLTYGLTETVRAVADLCHDRVEAEPMGSLSRENWQSDENLLRRITKRSLATNTLRNRRDKQ